jgi:hypothetical protein
VITSWGTRVLLCALVVAAPVVAVGQGDATDFGTISGSIQFDGQTYREDSIIGAPDVPEKFLSNTFANLTYTRGGLSAGVRFEAYLGPLLGYDPRYTTTGDGTGIGFPYLFARYQADIVDITVGNFYEQFGSGMILRTYEERNLGFDNSLMGIRAKFKPIDNLTITGLVGRQRSFWDLSQGIVRGADAEWRLGEGTFRPLPEDVHVTLGAAVVSRFQTDDNPLLKLPENVLAWSSRLKVEVSDFSLDAEYAYKVNDPSEVNLYSYNTGNALWTAMSYSTSGLGVNLAAKRIDNFDFRSDRTMKGNAENINYLPALTKQHTWRLITLYPYATQPLGEFGLQGDVVYTVPKGSFLGDDETTITLNYSQIYGLDTTAIDAFTYDAEFMCGDELYFRDFNIEVTRKFGKKFKATAAYINIQYNKDVIEFGNRNEVKYGTINAQSAILELTFYPARGQSLRTEFQYMSADTLPEGATERAVLNGDWAMALVEYTISPAWFFTLFTEYNYGNSDEDLRVFYPNANVAFVHDALRVQAGYGRVRGGILCVGGICRPVPAYNGFSISTTYTF